MTFGQKVYELRANRNWTQEQFGKAAMLTPSAVWRIEKDKGYPNYGTICLIATGFKITLEELFKGVDMF